MDIKKLKALAIAADMPWFGEGDSPYSFFDKEDADFICAASPQVVCELIAEVERTESRLHEVATACAAAEQERDQLKAEVEALSAGKNAIECRFEVSKDTLDVIRGCLRQAESEIEQLRTKMQPSKTARALNEAVSAIYFDDSSDYESALWGVVRYLAPELVEELKSDPGAVWHKTEAMAAGEASA